MKIEVTLEELKDLIRGDKDKIELGGKEYTLSDEDRVLFKFMLDYKEDGHQSEYFKMFSSIFNIINQDIRFRKDIINQKIHPTQLDVFKQVSDMGNKLASIISGIPLNVFTSKENEAREYQDKIKDILQGYETKQQKILRTNPHSFPRKEEEQWQRFVEEHLQKQLEESNQQEIFNALTQGNNEGFYSKPFRLVNNLEEVDSFDLFIQSEPFEYYRGIFDEFTTPKVIEDRMQSSNYVVPNKCAFNAYKEYCNKHDLKLLECDGTENEQSSRFHARLIAFFRDKGWYFINNNGMDMDKVLDNFKNMNPVIFKLGSNNPCYYGFRLKEVK